MSDLAEGEVFTERVGTLIGVSSSKELPQSLEFTFPTSSPGSLGEGFVGGVSEDSATPTCWLGLSETRRGFGTGFSGEASGGIIVGGAVGVVWRDRAT